MPFSDQYKRWVIPITLRHKVLLAATADSVAGCIPGLGPANVSRAAVPGAWHVGYTRPKVRVDDRHVVDAPVTRSAPVDVTPRPTPTFEQQYGCSPVWALVGSGTLATVALAAMLLLMFCARSAASNNLPECQDNTPHEEQFVTVAPGVRLEVLDWGGSGEAMVLLTGLGDNAHVYDQFAFQFTDYFHVIGITRRGYLPSSQPGDGYDIRTRVSDDIAVLDALGIEKAVLVGHSVAGSEFSAAAELHKDRVDKLVYLDAYDLAGRFDLPDIPQHPALQAQTQGLYGLFKQLGRGWKQSAYRTRQHAQHCNLTRTERPLVARHQTGSPRRFSSM